MYSCQDPLVYMMWLLDIIIILLTLAAKHRWRITAIVWRFLSVRPSVCPSIRPNPPVLNGKGRLRESTHSRHKGIVVMLSPAQCSSVQLLPVCVYMAPTSATWLIAILCFAGQLSMQWQCKQAVALKCIIQFRYITEAFSLYSDIAWCLPSSPQSPRE